MRTNTWKIERLCHIYNISGDLMNGNLPFGQKFRHWFTGSFEFDFWCNDWRKFRQNVHILALVVDNATAKICIRRKYMLDHRNLDVLTFVERKCDFWFVRNTFTKTIMSVKLTNQPSATPAPGPKLILTGISNAWRHVSINADKW